MANNEVSVRGIAAPSGYPMNFMKVGDVGILTHRPEGHDIEPGEPVLRTHQEFYFIRTVKWCGLSSGDGYYVRNLSTEEQIVIRGL